jgi:hypothetical protein
MRIICAALRRGHDRASARGQTKMCSGVEASVGARIEVADRLQDRQQRRLREACGERAVALNPAPKSNVTPPSTLPINGGTTFAKDSAQDFHVTGGLTFRF